MGKYGLNVLFRGLIMAEDILGREERNQLDFQIPGWKGAKTSVL